MVGVSGFLLLLLLIILLCIFKQRKEKRRRAAEVTQDDENPVYGDYSHPDPRMEVEDTNDYYSSGLAILRLETYQIGITNAYYSSDYEAGSGTTDNNPTYEN